MRTLRSFESFTVRVESVLVDRVEARVSALAQKTRGAGRGPLFYSTRQLEYSDDCAEL